MGIKETLRQCTDKFIKLEVEERVQKAYSEVIDFAFTNANTGSYLARFSAYWDISNVSREVCRRLSEDGILSSITNYDDEDVTNIILSGGELDMGQGICEIYLAWRD